MGKAADNERIKLRATFFNNLSVALLVAGVLIPYLAIFDKIPEIREMLLSRPLRGEWPFTLPELEKIVTTIAALAAALYFSYFFRKSAVEEIGKIKD